MSLPHTTSAFGEGAVDLDRAAVRYGYAAYGDPEGLPVLFFPGTPGSRRTPAWLLRGQELSGLRLIAVERPGWGLSTPQPAARLTAVTADIDRLCTALGLDRVVVLGMSGGGPYAYAAAAQLPHRVRGAVVVSGAVPLQRDDRRTCEPDVRFIQLLGRWAPAPLLRLLGNQMRRAAGDLDDIDAWRRSIAQLPEADRDVMLAHLDDGEFRRCYREDITEAYRSPDGFVRDCRDLSRLPAVAPEPQVPVRVLHGIRDRNVPLTAAERYYGGVSGVHLTTLDTGHLLPMSHWPVVADALRELGAQP